jgi:hypothetical protein
MQEPLKLDIVISFPDHGFHIRFDPWSQVLLLNLFGFLLGFLVVLHCEDVNKRILFLQMISGMMKLLKNNFCT